MLRWTSMAVVSVMLGCFGCDDPNGFEFERFQKFNNKAPAAQAQPVDLEEPDDSRLEDNRNRWNADNDDGETESVSRKDAWGGDRDFPGDRMPSRSERWGRDRSFPSDEMPSRQKADDQERDRPSDSLPSRTEKWGRDRELPSDRPNWGKDRKMPSDTAFGRSSGETFRSNSNDDEAPDSSDE
jgi:hypothetical protein